MSVSKVKDDVTTEIIDVTPAMAMKWMQKNNANRPISDVSVKRYAKAMRDGKWEFNGEAIIIAKDGTLVDGQHRLQALMDSGSTIKMVVVSGVKHSVFKTVDVGRKRTGGDTLVTFDKSLTKNRAVISAAITTILAFDSHGIWDDNSRERPSHDDLIAFMDKNKSLLRSVDFTATLSGARKFAPYSALAALHFLFSKKDQDQAERFFHKLNTGENLTANDPVLLLRNRLIQMNHFGGVFRTREVMPYMIKAWELIREGREVTQLRVTSDYVAQIK